jgi:hypothetical protein
MATLPHDILEQVFRLVQDEANTPTLRVWARLSRVWTAPAQRTLFSIVALTVRAHPRRLLFLLRRAPHLQEYVRTLNVAVDIDEQVRHELVPLLSHIRRIVCTDVAPDWALLSSFARLTSVRIHTETRTYVHAAPRRDDAAIPVALETYELARTPSSLQPDFLVWLASTATSACQTLRAATWRVERYYGHVREAADFLREHAALEHLTLDCSVGSHSALSGSRTSCPNLFTLSCAEHAYSRCCTHHRAHAHRPYRLPLVGADLHPPARDSFPSPTYATHCRGHAVLCFL